jgi:acetolactate synthase I/II/III large subunit
MIRVADFIVKYLENYGIKHIFMISGGGAMHLNDAVGRNKNIKYICNHHEQASAIAAEGYARVKNELAVVVVTSGPGGTNTLTGVIGQWLDSVPVLYISGQVKFETTIASCPEINLRQLGDQEINITDIVKPVTKSAVMLTNPEDVKKELEKAIHIATSGRPGPVWIDVPLNVQGALIDEYNLHGWNGKNREEMPKANTEELEKVFNLINKSERPVIIAGHGIRIAGAQTEFLNLIDKLRIPVLTTFNGFDLIPTEHELFIGRIGTLGSRAGNFALQNSDLVVCIGTRNNIRQVSYDWKNYAKNAKKIVVDIDARELDKPTVKSDLTINSDAFNFITTFAKKINKEIIPDYESWIKWCFFRKNKYPVVIPEYEKCKKINPYYFVERLTSKLNKDSIAVAGNGTACVTLFQAGVVKEGQRIFWNSGCASMGYDLPAAIGACVGGGKEVVCIAGDGSLMMNLQELQTVIYNKLPIKLFILNNDGYISIKQTQNSFFNGNLVASGKETGVSFPQFINLSKCFGFKTVKITETSEVDDKLEKVLNMKGPVVCEVVLKDDYIFQPKLSSLKTEDGRIISKPLEDLYPFLDKDELNSNMVIEPVKED